MNKLFTIGFTKKTAKEFFTLIHANNIKCVIDVRLNNLSQLAGFSKKQDLEYFLKALCACEYKHMPDLAPSKELFDLYKKKKISWKAYTIKYDALLMGRMVENDILLWDLERVCLLCSEQLPDYCHRKLAAEYLTKNVNIDIVHL